MRWLDGTTDGWTSIWANSRSLLKLMSITSVMPSNCLILRHPLLLMPSILPSIRVFSNESVLCIRWPEYWSFSFSISPVLIFRTNRGGGFTHKPGQAVGHHHRRWLMPHVIVVQSLSRVQLCDPMDCSTSVLHYPPEFVQVHLRW